jgi:WD40 repeat protein
MNASGKVAVSTDQNDITIHLWNLKTGSCELVLRNNEGRNQDSVESVAITPDGRIALSGNRSGGECIWDLKTGKSLRHVKMGGHIAKSLDMTPDGRIAISTGDSPIDDTIRLWNLKTGRCVRVIRNCEGEPNDWVRFVLITPDGRHALSRSFVGTIRLWDLEKGQVRHYQDAAFDKDNVLLFSQDGSMAISESDEHDINFWDLRRKRDLQAGEFRSHKDKINQICVSRDLKYMISSSNDKPLLISELPDYNDFYWACPSAVGSYRRRPERIHISEDGHIAIFGWDNGDLACWDLKARKSFSYLKVRDREELLNNLYNLSAVSASIDNRFVYSGYVDGALRVWDLKTEESVRKLWPLDWEGFERLEKVTGVLVGPDDRLAITTSEHYDGWRDNSALNMWHLDSEQCIQSLADYRFPPGITMSPDGRLVLIGSMTGLDIWDFKRRERSQYLASPFEYKTYHVGITNDGKYIVFGGSDGLVLHDIEGAMNLAVIPLSDIYGVIINDNCVVGCHSEGIFRLELNKLNFGPSIVTPVRKWVQTKGWNDYFSTRCKWCKKEFAVSTKLIEIIYKIYSNYNITHYDSPCLNLPDEAWEEPGLLSECPHCHKPLKFNPFIVDNSERY